MTTQRSNRLPWPLLLLGLVVAALVLVPEPPGRAAEPDPEPGPHFPKSRRVHRLTSSNNLKQIALAFHSFHDTYGGMPAAAICDKAGKPLLSWRVAILPWIEEGALYKQFKLDEPWDSKHNKALLKKM